MAKTPRESNTALAKKYIEAQNKAEQAQAEARLVEAQIGVKGKQVVYDYNNNSGRPKIKVVDRPKR